MEVSQTSCDVTLGHTQAATSQIQVLASNSTSIQDPLGASTSGPMPLSIL